MRKMLIMMLAVFFCASLALSACSKDQAAPAMETKNAPKESASASNVTPVGQFPVVKDKITLKVAIRGSSLVEDMKTNGYTKWLENKTNVHVDWTILDEKSYQEQLNLLLAGGNLPDVLMNLDVSPEQQMIYGEQGTFVSFTDLIEKYGDNTKKIFAEMPEAKSAVTAPGNKIYTLPYINDCFHCSLDYKMYVYKPWLDKLGLKEPTTLDEFYNMLKAFKEKDPNGNGKADEIALIGGTAKGVSKSDIDVFLMNSFIYDDGNKRMIVNNGKVDVAYNKPEWKEGLKYLNKLYKDGLLDRQSFTIDKDGLKKIAENPDIAIGGAIPAHSPSDITIVEGKSGRWLEYQPIAPLKGPNGVQKTTWLAYDKISNGKGQFIMTNANKNPEATMRWADAMYTFEASLYSNFGVEGSSWEKAKPGDLGRDGNPASYRLLIPFGRVQNESWAQYGLNYRTDKDYYAGQAVLKLPDKEKMYYDITKKNYEPYKPKIDEIIPPLFFMPADAQQLAELDKTINDYVKSSIARFVTGDTDIEKEWANYVATLDKMNLKKYLEFYQKALDAKNGKK
ncbi:putative aldouronate transport system substrate-binding protein [Paenibacillus sp. 1_12]|uniref:extracellular solute-binding protein n=1 Tax=Paenibacillus sp. 1_12 TaxID=1566278 RepID=UPI0008DFCA6D|nr:extracellular solute-binding protein [Paenibacillus sp. 1_12]SFL36299.1 putative aldouronate transport system substrate-binding protein [Paenibacillus sp. 1_12]